MSNYLYRSKFLTLDCVKCLQRKIN